MEDNMQQCQERFAEIAIPSELDLVIEKSIQKGKRAQMLRWMKPATAVACLATFILTVNVFPSFAAYLDDVPVVSKVVEFVTMNRFMERAINHDQGLENAVQAGFGQGVSKIAHDKGITFTLDNVIADQKRMIISYSVQADKKDSKLQGLDFYNMQMTDEKGQIIAEVKQGRFVKDFSPEHLYSLRFGSDLMKDPKYPGKLMGYMEFQSGHQNSEIPQKVIMTVTEFRAGAGKVSEQVMPIKGNWQAEFDIDAKVAHAQPQIYNLQKSFEIQALGHKLEFLLDYAKVYPTMTALKIDLVNGNELTIHGKRQSIFYTMHLEDEQGHLYKKTDDGVLTDSGNTLPEFESTYFTKPKGLYLVLDSVTIGSTPQNQSFVKLKEKVKIY